MTSNGVWTDLIDEFMEYTENATSPEIYRLWAGISMVSGALERRVWTQTGDNTNFANLYILLVGTPGVGKKIIEEVGELWRETKEPSGGEAFSIASDSTTKAALIDSLCKAEKTRITRMGQTFTYHSILVPAEEFEVLLPYYDSEFIAFLNKLWNNSARFTENRRYGPAKNVDIDNPFMHILGGVQPAWFVSHFPESAWETGLIRRIIMIYAETTPKIDPFKVTPHRRGIKDHILERLGHLSSLQGPIGWEQSAVDIAVEWNNNNREPVPAHSKLAHYNTTRWQFMIKLAMTSAVSRDGVQLGPITEFDVKRALKWLFEAELRMEDIFRSLIGKSDSSVIEELHMHTYSMWTRNGKEGVSDIELHRFLMTRVTSEKIRTIISTAEKGGLIMRVPGTDRWLPLPRDPQQLH